MRIESAYFDGGLQPERGGVLRPDRKSVIGNGVVLDPIAFLNEVRMLREAGVDVNGRLFVSSRAHVILPYHRMIELAAENAPGRVKIGTTSRGIGPVGRKLPVAIFPLARIRLGIGMTFNRYLVGQLAQFLCQADEQLSPAGGRLGTAAKLLPRCARATPRRHGARSLFRRAGLGRGAIHRMEALGFTWQ